MTETMQRDNINLGIMLVGCDCLIESVDSPNGTVAKMRNVIVN